VSVARLTPFLTLPYNFPNLSSFDAAPDFGTLLLQLLQ
jgi:hypothetical protein